MRTKALTITASIAVATIAAAVIFATSSANPKIPAEAVTQEPSRGYEVNSFDTPEKFMAEQGGRAAVIMQKSADTYKLSRGESATIPIELTSSSGGKNPSEFVNIEIASPHGYFFYPAAVAELTTEEERTEAALTGKLIPGSIDLGTFIRVDEENDLVRMVANQSRSFQLTLTVPEDLPESMSGKTIEIPIIIAATDDKGNPDTVYALGDFVVLEIAK